MRKILFVTMLTGLLSVACAPVEPQHDSLVNIEPRLAPYVARFMAYSKTYGGPQSINDLVIRLDSSMPGPTSGDWILGVCSRGGNATPEIRINPSFWNNNYYSNADREELLFHEMGHCLLNRLHDTDKVAAQDGGSVAESIMYPYHLGYTFSRNYVYYIKELFFQAPTKTLYAFSGSNQFDGTYYTANASTMSEPETETSQTVAKVSLDEETGNYRIDSIKCGEE